MQRAHAKGQSRGGACAEVFQAPAKFTDPDDGRREKSFEPSVFPVYWHEVYKKKYFGFIAALGRRYDGHPAIEMMGLGHNAALAIAPWDGLKRAYEQQGYTKDLWLKTVVEIAEAYRRAFPRTPLMAVIGPIDRSHAWRDLTSTASPRRWRSAGSPSSPTTSPATRSGRRSASRRFSPA